MWSWVLAAIGVTGIFLVGRKTIWGWLILCVNEVLWIAYALATDQYGFIAMALAYAAVYIKSYIHWRNDDVISEAKSAAVEENIQSVPDINKLMEKQRDFE
jgi:nicotinamide riboside transporter PnuC